MKRSFVAAGAWILSCGTSPEDSLDLTVELARPLSGYQAATRPKVIPPGEELYTCDVVRMDRVADEQLIWINGFESKSSAGTHHMNAIAGIFSIGDAIFGAGSSEEMLGRPLGQYPCAALGDLMKDQDAEFIYASQRAHQGGTLPPGVAVPAIAPLVLVLQHHYINTNTEPVLVNAVLNFSTIPESRVEHVATAMTGQIDDVELPPMSRKIESRTCVTDRDLEVVIMSSHSHERAECFTMNLYDGSTERVAEAPFFVNDDWESPPIMFMREQDWTDNAVYPLRSGDGVHWACHYRNAEDRWVRTGESADDEMCLFVAIGYPSPLSVAEIKEMVENPSLDSIGAFDSAFTPCAIVEAESPWPNANRVMPMESKPLSCR